MGDTLWLIITMATRYQIDGLDIIGSRRILFNAGDRSQIEAEAEARRQLEVRSKQDDAFAKENGGIVDERWCGESIESIEFLLNPTLL